MEQVPMGFMASGGRFNDGNTSNWLYQKRPSFPNQTFSENTNWDTASVCISVAKEATRKATGRVNAPLEFWGCNNSPIYNADRFHTYSNFSNKMDLDVVECVKLSMQEYAQRN